MFVSFPSLLRFNAAFEGETMASLRSRLIPASNAEMLASAPTPGLVIFARPAENLNWVSAPVTCALDLSDRGLVVSVVGAPPL